MKNRKILFVGSVGSGKSTIVENLSSIPVLTSEVDSTVNIGKKTTTVGIDFGYIQLSNNEKISLYGVPGQRKYSFLWDHVSADCWGTVILIKNNCKKSIDELIYLIEYLKIKSESKCIVCITHSDISSSTNTCNRIHEILASRNLSNPVYSINANLKRNAHLIIQTLIALEETGIAN